MTADSQTATNFEEGGGGYSEEMLPTVLLAIKDNIVIYEYLYSLLIKSTGNIRLEISMENLHQ